MKANHTIQRILGNIQRYFKHLDTNYKLIHQVIAHEIRGMKQTQILTLIEVYANGAIFGKKRTFELKKSLFNL